MLGRLLQLLLPLGVCLIAGLADAHVLVYRRSTSQLLDEYNDLPAQFGPAVPQNSLKVYPQQSVPMDGCAKVSPPRHNGFPQFAKFVAVIERGGVNCTFEKKVRNAQSARFDAVIVYNNEGDDLEQMSAQNASGIYIPAVFVGQTSGESLLSYADNDVVVIINDELPFNINTQLILPFSILIGLCFVIMICYMIYKCIREQRRLQRHRLPKQMLRQLPITKFSKTDNPGMDTCVICLDDFVEGDKLRILPCRHPYHSHCIDPWLTENRRVCPMCKRKVFTTRSVRSNRPSRQPSLDSVTDTDDDTTPLLQPAANGDTAAPPAATDATRHGTFGRSGGGSESGATSGADVVTSDDENALLAAEAGRRVNPFDRAPNLPAHLAQQLSEQPRSFWSRPFFGYPLGPICSPTFINTALSGSADRFFRRPQSISVAAPPFIEDGGERGLASVANAAVAAAVRPPTASMTTAQALPMLSAVSNNILNPNLSGSFKDDDDDEMLPHQSIYEPIADVTPTTNATNGVESDSVFVQTPTQGGIGVVALPAVGRQVDNDPQRHYFI